ncbi:hypothetical protein E4U41_002356, partial [Claviceps citrina]
MRTGMKAYMLLAVLCALALTAACATPVIVSRQAAQDGHDGQDGQAGQAGQDAPSATIDTGSLTGISTTLPGLESSPVSRFLGIRFGQPPVRFAPAQPAQPWSGTYDATAYRPTCLQQFNYPDEKRNRSMRWFNSPPFPGSESEDCLFLNVYAPGSAAADAADKKAILVWIYGGSFKIGSAASPAYDGTQFAATQDVIIVTFNYRLGVFGFPGSPQIAQRERNLGLLDQRLALDWVQRNIAAFGGDPKRVTIFGESAGGGSVDVLVTAPPPDPLPFAAAIMQSGQGTTSVDNRFMNSKDSWRKLAREVGCSSARDDFFGRDNLLGKI